MSILKNKDNPKFRELRDVLNRAHDIGLIKSHFSEHEEMTFDEFESLNEQEIITLSNNSATWSKVCSCMDWLDVAKKTLDYPNFSGNDDEKSLSLMTFISKCDLLIESVEQLWIAVENSVGIDKFNFYSREIFNSNEFGRENSDKEHFKLLRAWFGFHGVNGNLTKIPELEEKVRFFSSWSSFDVFPKPSICLYSNNLFAEEKYGRWKQFETKKVIELINLYYNSVEILIDRVKEKLPEEEKTENSTFTEEHEVIVKKILKDIDSHARGELESVDLTPLNKLR